MKRQGKKKYRGVDNPNNGHGAKRGWAKSGVQMIFKEYKRPMRRGGHKSTRRFVTGRWVKA